MPHHYLYFSRRPLSCGLPSKYSLGPLRKVLPVLLIEHAVGKHDLAANIRQIQQPR